MKLLQMWAAMYWFSVYGARVKKHNEIPFEHRCKQLLQIEQEMGSFVNLNTVIFTGCVLFVVTLV